MQGKARQQQSLIKCQGRQQYSNNSREGKRTVIHKIPGKAREQQLLRSAREGKRTAIIQKVPGKAREQQLLRKFQGRQENSNYSREGKRAAITQRKAREQQSLKGRQENSNYSESAREVKRTATTHILPGKAREQQVPINCQGS